MPFRVYEVVGGGVTPEKDDVVGNGQQEDYVKVAEASAAVQNASALLAAIIHVASYRPTAAEVVGRPQAEEVVIYYMAIFVLQPILALRCVEIVWRWKGTIFLVEVDEALFEISRGL